MAPRSTCLERQHDCWELRTSAEHDSITARPLCVIRTFRGGRREASKSLAQPEAEVDSIGTHTDQSGAGLLLAHIDHPASGCGPLSDAGCSSMWGLESGRGVRRLLPRMVVVLCHMGRIGGRTGQSIDPRSTIHWVGCPVTAAMWSKSAS
jgi:hypothetical protein